MTLTDKDRPPASPSVTIRIKRSKSGELRVQNARQLETADPAPKQLDMASHQTEREPPAPSDQSSKKEEVLLLEARIALVEQKLAAEELKSKELDDSLAQAKAQYLTEVESKDKETAGLKRQLQLAIAESKALAEANRALMVDLNVYRKFIQFEAGSVAMNVSYDTPRDSLDMDVSGEQRDQPCA